MQKYDFKKVIRDAIKKLDEYRDVFLDGKDQDARTYYSNNSDIYLSRLDKEINSYIELKEENIAFINKEIQFLGKLLHEYKDECDTSLYFENILKQCVEEVRKKYINLNYTSIFNVLINPTIEAQYSVLLSLKKFSSIDNNIVLVGGNGKGKTSLVNSIKGNDHEVVSVIPAQKSLIYNITDNSVLKEISKKEMQNILLNNNFQKNVSAEDYTFFNYQNYQFTKLVLTMKREYFLYLKSCQGKVIAGKYEGIFGRCAKVFNILFPEICLDMTDDLNNCLICEKDGNRYGVNDLSDGEKSSLYYIMSVLLSPEVGVIIVDEPETYLNPSLTIRLWDLLISEKSNCQFIFVTHSVEFVSGRRDSEIAWIKEFKYPSEWEIKLLNQKDQIPREMITEILGTNKPLVFCEGNKGSLDYQVYQSILGNEYTVIPANGHTDVVNYTKALNKNKLLNYDVYGIIDGDGWTQDIISSYFSDKILVLPYNEIEMFLMCDEIVYSLMQGIYPEEYEERVGKFKEEFWKTFGVKKNQIVLNYVKTNLNIFLSHEKLNSCKTKETMVSQLDKYKDKVEELYEEINEKIETVLKEKDYAELLKYCSLKKEISIGLSNKYLDSEYENNVLQKIKYDKKLKQTLYDKNFKVFLES